MTFAKVGNRGAGSRTRHRRFFDFALPARLAFLGSGGRTAGNDVDGRGLGVPPSIL